MKKQILKNTTRGKAIKLNEKSWSKLMNAIDHPPKPTDELKALMRAK